jgi:quercetin dioxygenase-like cupin family protein
VTARRIDVTEDQPAVLARLAWRAAEPPTPASVADRLREEGVEPHQWSNGPGDRYGAHRHDYEKVLMCAAGSITFLVGPAGAPVELRAGEGFVLPAGTLHAAVVGPEGCVCVEGSR